MKNINLLLAILSISCLLTCSKDNEDTPELNVNTSSLAFDQDNYEKVILITNSSSGELSWEIQSKPDWIEVSKMSGKISSETDTLFINASIEMDVGTYSGEIVINSNGGDFIISVTHLISYKIGIFPGVGAADINLTDPFSQVLEVHGNYSGSIGREIYYPNQTEPFEYHKVAWYDAIKATFSARGTAEDMVNDYEVFAIEVEAPYEALTEKLIGIGSSVDEVVNVYGQPTVIEYGTYKYKSIGIHFEYDETTFLVTNIIVYIDNVWID